MGQFRVVQARPRGRPAIVLDDADPVAGRESPRHVRHLSARSRQPDPAADRPHRTIHAHRQHRGRARTGRRGAQTEPGAAGESAALEHDGQFQLPGRHRRIDAVGRDVPDLRIRSGTAGAAGSDARPHPPGRPAAVSQHARRTRAGSSSSIAACNSRTAPSGTCRWSRTRFVTRLAVSSSGSAPFETSQSAATRRTSAGDMRRSSPRRSVSASTGSSCWRPPSDELIWSKEMFRIFDDRPGHHADRRHGACAHPPGGSAALQSHGGMRRARWPGLCVSSPGC